MANSTVGLEVAKYLKERGEEIVGLCVHEEKFQKCTPEIIAAAGVPPEAVMEGPALRTPEGLARIRDLKPDIAIAAFWRYILKPDFLSIFPQGCINFHPGLLPYNRGTNPDVWPFIDGTPGGVTIHYVDPGVDTGDIIGQREVPILPTDVAGTFYERTLREIAELFKEIWPDIKAGTNARICQDSGKATHHKRADVDALDPIDLDRTYTGKELLNRLRARTHPARAFAYYTDPGTGKRIYVAIELSEVSERKK